MLTKLISIIRNHDQTIAKRERRPVNHPYGSRKQQLKKVKLSKFLGIACPNKRSIGMVF